MSYSTILNFCFNVFSKYAQSGVWYYLILPVFALGLLIMIFRVVKFIVSNN